MIILLFLVFNDEFANFVHLTKYLDDNHNYSDNLNITIVVVQKWSPSFPRL